MNSGPFRSNSDFESCKCANARAIYEYLLFIPFESNRYLLIIPVTEN